MEMRLHSLRPSFLNDPIFTQNENHVNESDVSVLSLYGQR